MGLQRPPFRIFLWANALQRRSNIARNNRLGIGFSAKVAQRLTLDAKASDGDDGINASARLSYVSKHNNEIHIGYALGSLGLSGTSGIHNRERKITAGTKFKATDTVSGFIENSRGQHANRTTIAKTYGYATNARVIANILRPLKASMSQRLGMQALGAIQSLLVRLTTIKTPKRTH